MYILAGTHTFTAERKAVNGITYAPKYEVQSWNGLYLDMYTTPENAKWYFRPTEGSRLRTFSENLAQAIDVADEYVWVYGEKCWFDSIEIIPLN